jgi:beta-glucosidase
MNIPAAQGGIMSHQANPEQPDMTAATLEALKALPFRNPDLPLSVRVTDLVGRLTQEEKLGLLPTRQAPVPRLGLREYHVGGEAAHGVVAPGTDTTVFPQTLGMAMTWDRDLLHRIGEVVGTEARALYRRNGEIGGLTRWAPTVDLERDPR